MDHYQDIRLLADPEFNAAILMNALFSRLHRALVTSKATDIGVSFPDYKLRPKRLGNTLRIHGKHNSLTVLQNSDWLKGMRDHSEVTEVKPIPANAAHVLVKRRQYKTNVDRLRRRRMKRKGETYEQVSLAIPDSVERKPELPFLSVPSLSTRQTFCLFVEQGPPEQQATLGEFNCYGFSEQATVPWF